MSSSLPSDEVAEDYKNALEDLVTNDRYSIANLTMIAKENIEHAEAISRVLTNHINRAPPTRKLPALYVLDSLVKNIGSPYTVYFGRNLHQTFMHAYSQVDSAVRKKLEEMLKTWREPVPGSLSTISVFPTSSTQTIIDALNRFRASTAPATQRQTPVPGFRPPHMQVPQQYRNTPTPPQVPAPYSQYPVPSHNEAPTPQPPTTYNPYLPQTQTPVYPPAPTPQWQVSTPQPQPSFPAHLPQRPPSRSSVDLPKLHADIDDLTTDAKIECATHPMDSTAQRKLSTLQTLKEILDSGTASEQDLVDIRNTIMQEMAKKLAINHQATPQPQIPQLPPQIPYLPSQPPTQPQYQQPPPVIPSFINSTNLAELLRATAPAQSTPPQQPSYPALYQPPAPNYNTPPVMHATPAPLNLPAQVPPPPAIPASAIPLLEQLRASGLLSATPTPPLGVTPPSGLPGIFQQTVSTEVQFTTASIKVVRPYLVANFLNAQPNQCSTCGKRFTSDEVGKEKKTRHLDWHFKTKARMIEAEKRGQNRSWYVDEREWIASREYEDDSGVNGDNQHAANGTSPSAKKKQRDFVRAPSDPVLRSAPCPIDQEPFKSEWSEEVQDFIWKDAIKVGSRYYHASCYREATQDRDKDAGGSTPLGAGMGRIATPDSVLGKRKAEREMDEAAKSRVKLEA